MDTHRLLRPLLACTIGIGLASCATRNPGTNLDGKWPLTEPTVDLSAYESAQNRPGQRKDIAVAVAISGGGMRAANFAAGVLQALEATPVRGADGRPSNLLREVDYFSTVSGGGLAAGCYITDLNEYLRNHPEDPTARGFSFSALGKEQKGSGVRNWRDTLSRDYQSSLVRAFFDPRMLGSLDRGDVLERRLDDSVLGKQDGRSLTLGDVFVPKGTTPHLPYWVANGTVYENGAIFPFTPDILEKYGITGYKHQMRAYRLNSPGDLPLAVGLKTSASFPVAIPPSTLKSNLDHGNPRLHLMDGGVADNLGVVTALRLLAQDRASRKVLIIIDAYNGDIEPFSKRGVRPGMVRSALRTTSISLDSSHQRLGNLLNKVGEKDGIQYALIDFHRALQAKDDEPGATGDEFLHALGIGRMTRDETSPPSIQAVFTQALGVATRLKIDRKAQDTLLKAGENAIYLQRAAPGSNGTRLLPEMRRIQQLF